MNTTTRAITVAGVAALIVVAPSLGRAVSPETQVQLTLTIDQQSYAPYEPVIVLYELTNASTSPAEIPNFLDHQTGGYLTFEIAEGDGAFRPFRTAVQGCGPYRTTLLPAGGRLSGQMTVVSNALGRLARTSFSPEYKGLKEYPFAHEGSFRMRASYALAPSPGSEADPPKLSAKPVTVVVRSMTEEERKEFAFFLGPADYSSAVGTSAESKDLAADIKRWASFADQFPASVYAPAIRLNLGSLFLHGTGLPSSDLQSAKASFTAAIRSRKRGLRGEAYLGLARVSVEQGRFDEARSAIAAGLSEALTTNERSRLSSLEQSLTP